MKGRIYIDGLKNYTKAEECLLEAKKFSLDNDTVQKIEKLLNDIKLESSTTESFVSID
jgi:hypothetical protein